MRKLIGILAALLLATPTLAGSWSQSKLRPGGVSVFTALSSDSGDQPRLDMTECFSKPEITAVVTQGSPSIELYLAVNGTNPSTNATLAATVTGSGSYSTVQAGLYHLLPKVVTAARGGQITVRCGSVAPNNAIRAGNRWVAGADLPVSYLRREPFNSEISASDSYGYEYWFVDFNDALDFSVAGTGLENAQSGSTVVAESQPFVTSLADATSPNTNQVFRWARRDVGTPTTFRFYPNKATGTGQSGKSVVNIGNAAADTSDGFFVFNPFFSWSSAASESRRQVGFVARIAKTATVRQLGAAFVGAANYTLSAGTPLTTSGTLNTTTADHYYVGFYVDASDNIFVAATNGNVDTFSFDTGFNLTTAFSTFELRGKIVDSGAGWQSGTYFDCFVNGIPVVAAAGRQHCIESSDVALFSVLVPLNPTIGYVHTTGGNQDSFRADYLGIWTDRLGGEQ